MARRRGLNHRAINVPPPYNGAHSDINKMERAVIYRSVSTEFTPDDLLDFLLPSEPLQALRTAWPHAEHNHGSWRPDFKIQGISFTLIFTMQACSCLVPTGDALMQHTVKAPYIIGALKEMAGIVAEFDKVRSIVSWFNDKHVTPGAARHYFPALGSLLPVTHPFHASDGARFKEPVLDNDVVALLRAAPGIIAKGLLCDPANHSEREGNTVRCQIDAGQVFNLL